MRFSDLLQQTNFTEEATQLKFELNSTNIYHFIDDCLTKPAIKHLNSTVFHEPPMPISTTRHIEVDDEDAFYIIFYNKQEYTIRLNIYFLHRLYGLVENQFELKLFDKQKLSITSYLLNRKKSELINTKNIKTKGKKYI